MKLRLFMQWVLPVTMMMSLVVGVFAQTIAVPIPRSGEYVRDLANLMTPEDAEAINEIGQALRNDSKCSLMVLTIPSMKDVGGGGLRMEQFTMKMVHQWQLRQKASGAEQGARTWHTKWVVLVVSLNDRRAWIEYDTAYALHRNTFIDLLDNHLVPYFEYGRFSEGIVHGVKGMQAVISGMKLPAEPVFFWDFMKYLLGGSVIFLIAVSVFYSGRQGKVWRFVRFMMALPNHLVSYLYYRSDPLEDASEEVQIETGTYSDKSTAPIDEADEEEEAEEEGEEEEEDEDVDVKGGKR